MINTQDNHLVKKKALVRIKGFSWPYCFRLWLGSRSRGGAKLLHPWWLKRKKKEKGTEVKNISFGCPQWYNFLKLNFDGFTVTQYHHGLSTSLDIEGHFKPKL